jgi:uncharacterized repeat protein (TIGR03806 family)
MRPVVGRADDRKTIRAPWGLDKRVPWTTSRLRGSPDPPSPYTTQVAFPKLKFDEPLDLVNVPGTGRLFVVERYGRVLSFVPDARAKTADLFLDLNQVLGRTSPRTIATYGFVAHPQFGRNGLVYVTYVLDPVTELPNGTRVAQFRAVPGDPPRCDPKSEQVLIEWRSGGHNGGCLVFGPDGCLYVATGDASGIADQYLTGQDLGTLAGKILRIDVDRRDPGKAYAIPKDNPFVDRAGARPEIWAYGLRQPWKMNFDPTSGDLWTGNVGQDLWEHIYRIERGGNYGWSVMEGSHPFRPERPRGPTPILMPIVEHDHASFRSITGGFVYRGQRLKELRGAYVYGDYDTGRIWMLRYDRTKKTVIENRELVDSNLRIVGFGEDDAGELYLLDHVSGRISRLAPNPVANNAQQFPRRLSETGLFSSTKDHQPAAGVIAYSVIAPQWCDGATKERFLALPQQSQIEFETVLYPQGAPGAPPGWRFPDGAVLAETLSLEMEVGVPASRRRLETRVLHQERLLGSEEVGDQYWQGYTYVWNDEQTDAILLEDPRGGERVFWVRDARAPGGRRQQKWRYPSRTECTVCHNIAAKYAIGVQTLQMNTEHDYNGVVANQLRTLEHIGIFTRPLPADPDALARLVDYRDASQDLHLRARSYLHANCAHCHRKWGGGNAEFLLVAPLELTETGALGARPTQGNFNIPNARVIAAGDPYRSVLFYRMNTLGPGRMPRLGSSAPHQAGLTLIHDWIMQLPGTGIIGDVATKSTEQTAKAIRELRSANPPVPEDLARRVDSLLDSPSAALRLAYAMSADDFPAPVRDVIVARATESTAIEVRDLFERFLPEERRVVRLGAVVQPEQILGLPGNSERGRKLFFEGSGVQCRSCHRIGGQGTEIGPDLDKIAARYDRRQILDNILNPSRQIEEKYLTYVVETKRGQVVSGILVSKDANRLVLKDANNKVTQVLTADVESVVAQQKSIMPDLLLRDLTAEQVADLTAFLASLK